MALLTGRTEDGQEVPVQVRTDGRLVAEGLTGPAGPQGPEGPEGPVGPAGPPGTGGTIVESGNEVNQYFVRYSDGTQVCWGIDVYGTTLGVGGQGPALGPVVTFPRAFIATPAIVASHSTQHGDLNFATTIVMPHPKYTNNIATAFIFRSFHSHPSTDPGYNCNYIAYGRWQ